MLKRISGIFFAACLISEFVVAETQSDEQNSNETQTSDKIPSSSEWWFVNLNAAHMRSNRYPFGPKNSSMISATPVIYFNNITIESDFSYGRLPKYAGAATGPVGLSKITGDLPLFFENVPTITKAVRPGFSETVNKAHFYRGYSRISFMAPNGIRVVVGDVSTKNTIGFQQTLSGGGINISRQDGDGSVINPGLPIVITKPSKVEVKLKGEILRMLRLAPGTYTVNDFGEEAKLPGVIVKITDQLGRAETFKVEYFSGYDMPAVGKDDFDATVCFSHYWLVDDPFKMRYKSKPRCSGNYRFTPVEDFTLAFGAQYYDSSYSVDLNLIFNTAFGKISPNVGYSDTKHGEKAVGAGIYYALPNNDLGIHFETNLSVQSRGYGDLGKSAEASKDFDDYMDKYFSRMTQTTKITSLREGLRNGTSDDESTRSVVARLYFDPIAGFVPAFIFCGNWANSHKESTQRLREYSVSLTKSFWKGSIFTIMAGLTYDDPSKGRNQESPDRRLTIAFSTKIGSQVTLRSTYTHIDDAKMSKYGCITYKPEAVKGLEINIEGTRDAGKYIWLISSKYSNKYLKGKAEQSQVCTYEDKKAATRDSHINGQFFSLESCLTQNLFRQARAAGFNIFYDYAR